MKYLNPCLIFLLLPLLSAANAIEERNLFALELFETLASEHQSENVVISPISVQLALGLLYYGAGGRTATELQKALHDSATASKDGLAESYHRLLNSYTNSTAVVKFANKLFTGENLTVASHFREVAEKYFQSEVEGLKFDKPEAVQRINNWVKEKTQNKIDHVVDSVDPATKTVLINAIYFKARWENTFYVGDTQEADFWLNESKAVKVPTMYAEGYYKYAEYAELDAKAIELPFKDTNMTMWFILPNKRTGLRQLERELKTVDLKKLERRWQDTKIEIFLPKFNFTFDSDLKDTLKNLGINEIFSDTADLSNIFEGSISDSKVTKVQHKTFINLNEVGCEATGTTYVAVSYMSMPRYSFTADHPFVFIIRDQQAVYFTGHVAKF